MRLPLLVSIGGLAITATLWAALESRDARLVADRLDSDASLVAAEFSECVGLRVATLERAAAEWAARPDMTRAEWEASALRLAESVSGTHAVAWTVPETGRYWAVYGAGSEHAAGREISAFKSGTLVTDLAGGGVDICLAGQMPVGDRPLGRVAVLMHIDDVLQKQLESHGLTRSSIRVFDGGHEILAFGPTAAEGPSEWTRTLALRAPLSELVARVALTDEGVANARSLLPTVVLLCGAAVSVLLGIALRLSARARWLARDERDRARALAEEVASHQATAERLRESLAVVGGLFDAVPDALVVANRQGQIVRVNAQAEELFGWTRAELLAMQVEQLVPRAHRAAHSAWRAGFLDDPQQAQLTGRRDLIALNRDAKTFPIDITVARLTSDANSLVIAVVRDVTERRLADEALRASEAKFRRLFEKTADASLILDPRSSHFVDANEATVAMLRCPDRDAVLTRHPAEFSPERQPDGRSSFEKAGEMIEIARSSGSHRFEWVHCSPYRPDFPVEVLLTPTLIDGQEMVVVTWRDITQRKHAENALRASEENFRRVVEHISDGIVVDDLEGRVVFANDRFLEIFGITREELPSVCFEDYVAPADRAALRERHDRRMRGESVPAHFTYEGRHRDGTPRWIEVAVVAVHDEQGRTIGTQSAQRDVTERHLADAALQDSEERLRVAQKMEAVARLAGGVAHDFNNLLTVIQGYGELLTRAVPEGSIGHKHLGQIMEASGRAANLTSQLLAFSRRQVSQPEPLNLWESVDRSISLLQKVIGEDINIVTHHERLGHVMADRGQVEQVVMNLAINARDAMPGGGTLTFATRDADISEADARRLPGLRAGAYVRLSVTDTGCGMSRATIAKIFEPFFTTKELGKGTGLGLATVFGIVKQTGGTVDVQSELGRGSTFDVYLPRADEATVSAVHASSDAADVNSAPHVSETVLLAEDEEALRDLMTSVLAGHGYRVISGATSEAVIAAAAAHDGPIELLVTDVIMPNVSGPEVAARVRERRPDIRVLYVSGYTSEIIGHHGVLDHDVAFLQKPFQPKDLLRKVCETLTGDVPSASTVPEPVGE